MKTTELQIFDWVKIDYNNQKVKVTAVYNNWIDTSSISPLMSKVSPIPLTPEILEKNGFEITPSSWEIEINNIAIVIVKKQDDYLLSISEPYCDGIAKGYHWIFHDLTINHVHQLQHSLRLCGLNELADNLKLEE